MEDWRLWRDGVVNWGWVPLWWVGAAEEAIRTEAQRHGE